MTLYFDGISDTKLFRTKNYIHVSESILTLTNIIYFFLGKKIWPNLENFKQEFIRWKCTDFPTGWILKILTVKQ